jgi:adenylate cyclase
MKKLTLVGLVISSISVVLVLLLYVAGALTSWENKFYDYKFLIRGSKEPSRNVVIIGIDADSLARFGRFPWPRGVLAKGIINLKRAGVKVIGTDIIFPERSQDASQDEQLAGALRYSKNVVGAIYFEMAPEKTIEIVEGKMVVNEILQEKLILPIPRLMKAFCTLGFTNAYPDNDGGLRKTRTRYNFEGEDYYSLNLKIASQFLDRDPASFKLPEKLYANFRGGTKTYTHYSFMLIYDATFPRDWVKGKIALIGSTATGAYDHYPTPYDKIYPGVEFHATAIDNVISNDFIRPEPAFLSIILAILLGIGMGQVFLRIRLLRAIMVFVLSLGFYFFLTEYFIFAKYNFHTDFLKPGLSLILSFSGIMGYRLLTEEKEKRWIKKTFSYYLSPDVINELASNPDKLRLGGERKTLTVLFSDIRNFTVMSEKLNPEEVVGMLNEYLSAMTEIVFKNSGTLDKFIGDAVMAFWGAPIYQEDHAERAVRCAVEMMEKLHELQEMWRKQNKPVMNIGIGVNTGEMVVGNLGSQQRMAYTVIGDNVNLGSRLEGLNKQYNTHIIISESTYEIVKDKFNCKPLGQVSVKGKEKPVNIFEVLKTEEGSSG